MQSDGKQMLKDCIRRKTDNYELLELNFKHMTECGFDSTSTRIESVMIEMLAEMIQIKNDIRELEIFLLYGEKK